MDIDDLPENSCAAFQMTAEVQLDKESNEIVEELAERGVIEKDKIFNADMLTTITKHASVIKFNDLHMPVEFIFDDTNKNGILPGMYHGLMFANIETEIDEAETTITFKIYFRLAFLDNEKKDNRYVFGILSITYKSANPSEQEINDLTQYVLNNIPRA